MRRPLFAIELHWGDGETKMAEHDQKPKQKMFTEDEHNRKVMAEIERQRSLVFCYSIAHSFASHGSRLSPEVKITLTGGDTDAVHVLALEIERRILDFARTIVPTAHGVPSEDEPGQ